MPSRRASFAVLLLASLLVALLPGVVAAHSELETSDPADGATLSVSPVIVTGDFSEEMDPARSSMELRGPDGAQIATGGVPADGPPTRMSITGPPTLGPGAYEVRWTTVTADDDGVERGTFTFTIVAAVPSPTGTTTASPAASPAPVASTGSGLGDVLIPVVVLGLVLVAGAVLFLRRRQ